MKEAIVIEETKASENNMDVVRLNFTDQGIAKFKKDYLVLKVNGLEDKKGLQAVYEARQDVKRTRVSVEKFADKLKEKALEYQRKVNLEKNRVVGELKVIEEHLQGEEDKVAAEKQLIEDEKQKLEEQRIQVRIDALQEFGYKLDYAVIKALDEKAFETILVAAKDKYEVELRQKAAQEEADRLEKIKVENERKELEELRKKNEEQQKQLQRQQAEQAAERLDSRIEIVKGLGLVAMGGKYTYNLYPECSISIEQIGSLSNEDFQTTVAELRQNISSRKVEEGKEKDKLVKEAQDKAKVEKDLADLKKKQEDEEKLALAPDKDKFQTVIDVLWNLNIPAMKSNKGKTLAKQVDTDVKAVVTLIQTTLGIK